MPLLNDSLSVWEIAFRWTGHDPTAFWLRLPLDVRDHFRNMMDAILAGELSCESITLEKRVFEPEEKKFSVYYWLDFIDDCIHGHYFYRKLLRHAQVERYDLKLWCERRNIPLPEFWFPTGWNLEYEFPEGDLLPGYYYMRKDWKKEDWVAWAEEQNQRDENSGDVTDDKESAEPSENKAVDSTTGKQEASAEKLRPNQEARIACRQIAKAIWKENPDRTIASIVEDPLIQKYGGAASYADETVREWARQVAPQHVRDRRGRPKNEAKDK